MHLDFQTLYIVAATSLAATGAIVALVARTYSGDLSCIGYLWAMAVGFAMLGYVFVALRGSVPDTVSILGGHATGVAATCGFYHACLRLTKRKAPLLLIYSPVAVATASAAYFSLHAPNLSIRVAIFSALAALPMGLCAVTLAPRRGASVSLTSNVGSLGFALGGAVLLLRAAVRLTHDPAVPMRANFASSPVEQLSIMLTFVVFSALSLLFLIICNDRLHRELERLATLDPLTERFNRRTIEELGRREVENARRRRSAVAVALLDIDHFKQINDRHGHAAGDTALRSAVAALEQNLRDRDILGRYGGDELLVVMPDTDAEQAAAVCERLRELLARLRRRIRSVCLDGEHRRGERAGRRRGFRKARPRRGHGVVRSQGPGPQLHLRGGGGDRGEENSVFVGKGLKCRAVSSKIRGSLEMSRSIAEPGRQPLGEETLA